MGQLYCVTYNKTKIIAFFLFASGKKKKKNVLCFFGKRVIFFKVLFYVTDLRFLDL